MDNKNINTNGTDGKPPVIEPTSPTKVQPVKEKEKPDKGGDSDSERLEMIKELNGLKEKDMQNPDRVECIEMVLEDLGKMGVIARFKNLKTLTLINQNIKVIEGLDDLFFLESLWLNENRIGQIECLTNCKSLRNLYLSNNEITKLEGLDNLSELEIFWICENQIRVLENLDGLNSLKQFWISGNQIEHIKNSLDKLSSLNDLNLSGNKICSFKEILNLTRLPKLEILSFYDPHYGDNPICLLGNYQTFVLYHLSNITQLDTLWVSENARNLAETTFMKKKMYYNMKIKTILRCFSSVFHLMKRAKNVKLDLTYTDIEVAEQRKAELIQAGKADTEPEMADLERYLKDRVNELQYTEDLHKSLKRQLYGNSKQYIHKLMAELDTGGNIRLEEGTKTDKWYISCIDLLKSRFHAEEMAEFNITDIEVKRIVRIHNRFLKNKFEDRLESLVDVSNSSYKKAVEYLFYGVDPKAPQEIFRIIEEGYRGAQECQNVGICPFTPLVNSILAADLPRIRSVLNNNKTKEKYKQSPYLSSKVIGDLKLIPSGHFLICKVLILKGKYDSINPNFDLNLSPTENFYQKPLDPKSYTNETSIFRLKEGDNKHKLWFVLDGALVQPEFLVEFDYVQKMPFYKNNFSDLGDFLGYIEGDEFLTPNNMAENRDNLDSLYTIYNEKIQTHEFQIAPTPNMNENFENLIYDIQRSDIPHIKAGLINYLKFATARSPMSLRIEAEITGPQKEEIEILTDTIASQGKDPAEIVSVVYPLRAIKSIEGFEKFKNLEHLNLSFNNLAKISGLEKCLELKTLDVSHNMLCEVEGLHTLTKLTTVYLHNNQIPKIDDIYALKFNSSLRELSIRGNLLSFIKGFKTQLFQLLPNLTVLDGQKINEKDKQETTEQSAVLNDELIIESSKMQAQANNPSLLKGVTATHEWKAQIEVLNLSHLKIKKISSLNGMINLQQANFSHNLIEKIENLDCCPNIEELNLEKNKITKIEGLDSLFYLKKLELGKNKISVIENLSHLESLNQLSLEDNQIDTIADFPHFKNLMELYIGNNYIESVKEIKHLSELPKLIILDITGNPLTKETNYRIFILFYMKKLKVLDGISIEASEAQLARETFTGRLSDEVLETRLNGVLATEVRALDLSNCKLRDFDDMFTGQKFPHLRELNLGNNLFQSLRCIGNIPHLRLLNMTGNKIESLVIPNTNILENKRGLNGLQNLEALDLSFNQLRDFNGLQFSQLKELRILKANNNEITKIEYLDNLLQLKELNVNNNKIRQFELSSFSPMNSIKCLKINDNGLRNFANIQRLYKMQHLFANSNRINDFPDVDKLLELPNLKELELNGNPLCRRPGYRQILLKKLTPLLYLDGKEILQDERERTDQNYQDTKVNQPMIYVQSQMPQSKVPVKMTSVNFGTVFSNIRGMPDSSKK